MTRHLTLRSIIGAAALSALSACGGADTQADPAPNPTIGKSAAAPTAKAAAKSEAKAPTGRDAFRRCATCHITAPPDTPKGKIRLAGPNLYGIVGAQSAQREGFAYSKALRAADIIWTDENLDKFIQQPQALIRGNRMAFAGERDAEKRAAIIAYLKSLDQTPEE